MSGWFSKLLLRALSWWNGLSTETKRELLEKAINAFLEWLDPYLRRWYQNWERGHEPRT
jgi:hypothetical protein